MVQFRQNDIVRLNSSEFSTSMGYTKKIIEFCFPNQNQFYYDYTIDFKKIKKNEKFIVKYGIKSINDLIFLCTIPRLRKIIALRGIFLDLNHNDKQTLDLKPLPILNRYDFYEM